MLSACSLSKTLRLKPECVTEGVCGLQDYVKWRGPLFHRFLLALVDDSPSVCALAEYLLTDTLASKVCCSVFLPRI